MALPVALPMARRKRIAPDDESFSSPMKTPTSSDAFSRPCCAATRRLRKQMLAQVVARGRAS
eukprot:2573585-Prymnesium_polylepis.1